MRRRIVLLFVFALLLLAPSFADAAHPFFNSREPGCDGSDPNVLMCDDFEDGIWYTLDCDRQGHPTAAAPAPGGGKGWCGTIYANPITPANAAVCGGQGAAGTSCAATSGPLSGSVGGKNMADHAFRDFQGVSEVYVRWYYWASPDYRWSQQKALTFNSGRPGDGGIKFGNFSFRCAAGGGLSSTANITMGFPPPQDECAGPNVSSVSVTGGRWWFIEAHMKLSDPGQGNGRFRLWMNDCGTTGVCTGTPTLRMDRANIKHNRASADDLIRVLWWENWGNSTTGQGSIGTEKYDQIKVSRVGPIGFMGSSTTPPPTAQTYSLTMTVAGQGKVTGGGVYPVGTTVDVLATADAGSFFASWSGACTGTGACSVTLDANKLVTATFTATAPPPPPPPAGLTLTIAKAGTGQGTVTSEPAGLACGTTCAGVFAPGTMVTITAVAAPGSTFAGWSQGSGTPDPSSNPSTFAISYSGSITATFTAVAPPPPPAPSMGTLTIRAEVSRCRYALVGTPPDNTGGWVAQFIRDPEVLLGALDKTPPYTRTEERTVGTYRYQVRWTNGAETRVHPLLEVICR